MEGTEQARTILITEDNPLHMKIFRLNLTVWGLTTIEATNGEQGLALAREHHPDLILVDLTLPKLDGWDLIARLRDDAATRDIPVVVVSARRPQDEADRALPVAAYVTKPFDPEALAERVAAMVRSRDEPAAT